MSAGQAAVALAHQGGWDELLLVAAPLSLFAALLYLANRRANRLLAHGRGPAGEQRTGNDVPDGDVPDDGAAADGGGDA